MSLRNIGRLGSGSSVRADLDAYLDDMDQLLRFVAPNENQTVRGYEVTVPAITAGSNYTLETDLGQLNYTRKVIFGMFSASATSVAEVEAVTSDEYEPRNFKGLLDPLTGVLAKNAYDCNDRTQIKFPGVTDYMACGMIVAYPNYEDTYRCTRKSEGIQEKYGSGAGTSMPKAGFSYLATGVGVLIGWYGTTGVWGIDKKVVLQSAWITVTTSTVLSLVIANQDSTTSSAKNLILGIFD